MQEISKDTTITIVSGGKNTLMVIATTLVKGKKVSRTRHLKMLPDGSWMGWDLTDNRFPEITTWPISNKMLAGHRMMVQS